MESEAKIAVIGDADSVTCFAAVGIQAFGVTPQTALATLKKTAKSYQIIFITDNYAQACQDFIAKFDAQAYPIILPIPSKDGGNGLGLSMLRAAGEKALGVDILFHKEDQ